MITKKPCSICGLKWRRLIVYHGKILCYKCYRKNSTWLPGRGKGKTLKQVLEKTHEVKGYLNKNNSIHCCVNLPSIMVGRKIKIILDENDEYEQYLEDNSPLN